MTAVVARTTKHDVVGYRARWGVIIPSPNTAVEHDFNAISPPGITFHVGRMYIERPVSSSDEEFEALMPQVEASLPTAIRDAISTKPDYMIMAMSAPTFWGGIAGNTRFTRTIEELSGLRVTTAAQACSEALRALGAQRIAYITPYQPIGDKNVERYFRESGFTVVRGHGYKRPTLPDIGEVTQAELIQGLRELDGDDIDAIVQPGTNFPMLRLADEAERWLGKPVIAINAATVWHALRASGFNDQFRGFGTLLRDH
jgi:maleate isomerase